MIDPALKSLAEAVQHNCNISDARHGADYSLCVYLMKMREYYRWEKHLPYGATLERDQVGNWLAAREQLWEELEGEDLKPLPIGADVFDPFDTEAINARLGRQGLVYSAGLGARAKPHFFLGGLECAQRTGDYAVFVSAEEYARDLTAPPAMTLGHSIFLRRESLRRMLWEKLEGWRWSRPDNALGRAFACYDFEGDLDDALDAMTDQEIRAALLHEQGEHLAGERLGPEWNQMLLDLAHTPAEIMARAVRDHLADCLVTLPTLAQMEEPASLHFYVGNLTAMRKEVFPSLLNAYQGWWDQAALGTGDARVFATLAVRGRDHWAQLARGMLALHREVGVDAAPAIARLVESQRL
jgi:Family of unknown function (DUF6866) C-terminal domain/Family of unknown function (DUF6866) N-terminal domain